MLLYGYTIFIFSSIDWHSGCFHFLAIMCNTSVNPSAAAAAKLLQSCLTLCDPIDGSPPGSAVPGILQARTLEWVAISFSSAWTWKVKVKSLSHVQLLATPWTAAYQAPLSMGFSRQEYWSRVPLPSLVNPSSLLLVLYHHFSSEDLHFLSTAPILQNFDCICLIFYILYLISGPQSPSGKVTHLFGETDWWDSWCKAVFSRLSQVILLSFSSFQFSHSVMSDSLWSHGLQHARGLSCPSPTPWVYPNSCPLSGWCHPTISSSVIPFSSCPQSFPASRSFQMSQLFASGGQSIGVQLQHQSFQCIFRNYFL